MNRQHSEGSASDEDAAKRGQSVVLTNTRPQIESLQWLRFVAATLVVLYHVEVQLFRLQEGRQNIFGVGAAGVDLFFVISGFVMVFITKTHTPTFLSFMRMRIVRIVPLYWGFTLVTLGLLLTAPALLFSTAGNPVHIITSFLFLPYPHPVLGLPRPLLALGWTLNYEMFFYCLFGAFLFLTLAARILAIACVLCLLVSVRMLVGPGIGPVDFYGSPIVLEFVGGMLVAWIYFQRQTLPLGILIGTIVISVTLIFTGIQAGVSEQAIRVVYWGLPAVGIVLASLYLEKSHGWPQITLLRHFGDASYSIYLSHLFVLAICTIAIKKLELFSAIGTTGSRIGMVAVALAVGSAIHVWIEGPIHRWLLRWDNAMFCAKSAESDRTLPNS